MPQGARDAAWAARFASGTREEARTRPGARHIQATDPSPRPPLAQQRQQVAPKAVDVLGGRLRVRAAQRDRVGARGGGLDSARIPAAHSSGVPTTTPRRSIHPSGGAPSPSAGSLSASTCGPPRRKCPAATSRTASRAAPPSASIAYQA